MKYLYLLFSISFSTVLSATSLGNPEKNTDVPYWSGFSGTIVHTLASQSPIEFDVEPVESCTEESSGIFKCNVNSKIQIGSETYEGRRMSYFAASKYSKSHAYYVRFKLRLAGSEVPTTLIIVRDESGKLTATRLIALSVDRKETILVTSEK
jgi:hypothetical protein